MEMASLLLKPTSAAMTRRLVKTAVRLTSLSFPQFWLLAAIEVVRKIRYFHWSWKRGASSANERIVVLRERAFATFQCDGLTLSNPLVESK